MRNLQYYLTVFPAVLIALTIHEMSHAYTAYLLGDPTASDSGRLTFNPISHIDPIGMLCMVFFGFGWARPVPINPRYFKNPKVGMAVTAFAGPLSNFILGFISILVYILIILSEPGKLLAAFGSFMYTLGTLSVGLGVFNLIPIPPLDGSKILFMFLPGRVVAWFYQYEGYIRLALLLCLYLGFMDNIIGWAQFGVLSFFWDAGVKLAGLIGLI